METPVDALELLTAQHRHMHELVERARSCVGQRGEAIAELADYMTAHLAVEQERFYPELSPRISKPVLAEILAEHAEIKRILADLLWLDDDDDARFTPKLAKLQQLLDGHAAWQDEELFESVAESMSIAALAELGASVIVEFDRMRDPALCEAA
jgi:hypothetical protein